MLLLQITMGVSVVSESAFAWPSKVSGSGENDAAPRISSAHHAARGKGRRVKQGRKEGLPEFDHENAAGIVGPLFGLN